MTTYLCPKCKKRNMFKNGKKLNRKTRNLDQQWICRGSGSNHGLNREYCYSTRHPELPYALGHDGKKKKGEKPRKKFKRKIDTSRIMIFTAAQNATPVHKSFFAALKTFQDDWDAELCVIPIRYKNPTSRWSASQQNKEYWLRDIAEAELAEEGIDAESYYESTRNDFIDVTWSMYLDEYAGKYLYEQKRKLNSNLIVRGDVKTQPTDGDPLTGMEGMTQGESGIFGHTKLRLKCIATPQNKMPKILTTTGACTVANYTDSKAGKKGEHHHVLGALVVEIKNDKVFHMYHINARKSDGAFIFLDHEYHASGKIKKAKPSKAIIFGDAHYRFVDKKVVSATFDKGGLVDRLRAKVFVWHDLLDCYWGNPHNSKNAFITIAKHKSGYHLAREEVEDTIAWMAKLGRGKKNYIIPSNHDDMFARWIIREDWKDHPDNAEFYLETALQMARSARMEATGAAYDDPFAYWVNQMVPDNSDIIALRQGEGLTIGDIELSFHGDKGPNGARGTIKNLSQIGVKVISGHGHSAAIQDGHTRTGTMTALTAEYTDGPGNWINAHASIDDFDKRHLHFCIDGDFGFNYEE